MANNKLNKGLLALLAGAALATPAMAGGLERAGYNIDLLFDPSAAAIDSSATFVSPQRDLKNVRDTNPADGSLNTRPNSVRDTESYWIPRIGVKARIYDGVDCMVDYSEPWGVHLNPGANWAGANHNIETKINSENYAATCSYKFDAGAGQLRFIGGVFYQEVGGFKDRLVAPVPAALGTGIGHLELEGQGYGWRTGVAYEIPEYAFRASLVYNSAVELDDISGTLDLRQIPSVVNPANPLLGLNTPVFGAANMPDSVELKLQSGIAPDWLAFGSIKWTDWSQLQSIPFCPVSTRAIACTPNSPTRATSLDLFYRDGWTVAGGIGHKFNDQWSGAVSLTWDRGTATGIGTNSDTWTVGTGVTYSPNKQVEFRLAGALGILTSGSSGTLVYDGRTYGTDVAYDYDSDVVAAISTGIKVKF